jgi:hypothetical protein
MGATTNLFPAMTLGSGSAGEGITSDNVSPMNLIYVRKVGYGVRNSEEIKGLPEKQPANCQAGGRLDFNQENMQILQRILKTVLEELKDSD